MLTYRQQWIGLGLSFNVFLGISLPTYANDIPSVFYISKNDNGNQIHYGMKLDSNCFPQGTTPVYVYWIRENGSTGNLLRLEEPAYGIYSQKVSGQNVDVLLNFFQNRGINKLITLKNTKLSTGTCQSQAFTQINRHQRRLTTIDINLTQVLRNPFTGSTIGGTVVNLSLIGLESKEIIPCTSSCRFGI